jgi:hypothetical protein
MKFAAKRTWPERPKSWEYQGEAETPEACALEFASSRYLALDTELVVMDRQGEDAEIQFFRVTGTDPYRVVMADPSDRQEPPATPSQEPTEQQEAAEFIGLRPIMSSLWFVVKVGFIAVAIVGGLGMLLRHFRGS